MQAKLSAPHLEYVQKLICKLAMSNQEMLFTDPRVTQVQSILHENFAPIFSEQRADLDARQTMYKSCQR